MRFAVIYTVDFTRTDLVRKYAPIMSHKWKLLEGDREYQLDYLAEDDKESPWYRGKHRCWAATFTKKEFDTFIYDLAAYVDDGEYCHCSIPTDECDCGPYMSFHVEDSYDYVYRTIHVNPLFDEGDACKDWDCVFPKLMEAHKPCYEVEWVDCAQPACNVKRFLSKLLA